MDGTVGGASDTDSDLNEDQDDAVDIDQGGTGPRKGSAEWWYQIRREKITPTSPVSVLQAAYWVAMMKQDLRISDAAVNATCRLIHFLLLPKGNQFPPSYYLVRAVLGVASGVKCTRHVCDKCWTLLPPLDPDLHLDHKDDQCANCGRTRFTRNVSGYPKPRRCVYYFGELECVLHLLTSPGMLPAIVAHRRESRNDTGSFLRSPAGQALDRACGFKFSRPGPLELAILFSMGVSDAPLLGWCLFHFHVGCTVWMCLFRGARGVACQPHFPLTAFVRPVQAAMGRRSLSMYNMAPSYGA